VEPIINRTPVANDIQDSIPNSLFTNLKENITQTYLETISILKINTEALGRVINTPAGSVVTKVISTTGVVAGTVTSIGALAFATPISFSEVALIPTRILGLILGALGIRRKNRAWGTVYDSVTKRPLDPAYVSLIDPITNKEIAGAITDIDGRYSFLPIPGVYRMTAQKTNYTFPSVKMSHALFDEVYNDIYHGEDITITMAGEIITKNIPLDPQNFDWNEFAKTNMDVNTFTKAKDITWAKISKVSFVIGFFISGIALFFAPEPYNIIITAVYLLAYILNYIVFKPQKAGTLTDGETGLPLAFAIVKVYREGEDQPMMKKIADKDGKYYILLPKGNYSIQIDRKNPDESYTQVYKSEAISFEKGIINLSLRA
jgi:hypothetical protein